MSGPILHTERLELRWLTPDDAAMMLAIWNDPAFLRYVGDRGVRTVEQARAAFDLEGCLGFFITPRGHAPER